MAIHKITDRAHLDGHPRDPLLSTQASFYGCGTTGYVRCVLCFALFVVWAARNLSSGYGSPFVSP